MMVCSKQQIIEHALEFLRGSGMDAICRVCIPNGGSCCKGCGFLKDREGCQKRNTGCTAWLCGYQQFLLFELGLLDKWNAFWDQVPGQDFRTDFTPDKVCLQHWMEIPDTREIGAGFALELQELIYSKKINTNPFNSKLFTLMDMLSYQHDNEIHHHILNKINAHMKDFKHYRISI